MRADAAANRARILAAARRALDTGTADGMAAVAKEAGVGQGTLYRHFPTWEALVIEAHRVEMEQVAAAAPALLSSYAPLDALRRWLSMLAEYGRLKTQLSEAMSSALHETLGASAETPDLGALHALVRACQADHSIRADITAEDLFLLIGFLWRVGDSPDRSIRVQRMIDVVLRGLREAN